MIVGRILGPGVQPGGVVFAIQIWASVARILVLIARRKTSLGTAVCLS